MDICVKIGAIFLPEEFITEKNEQINIIVKLTHSLPRSESKNGVHFKANLRVIPAYEKNDVNNSVVYIDIR